MHNPSPVWTQMLKNSNVWALTLLRIVTAFLFLEHGLQKLFGLLEHEAVSFPALMWFAGVLEFFGPLLVGFGLFTRPVAFLLSGEMAVAYFMAHFPRGFWPVLNGGERAILFCFIYLLIATAGPGRLALDNLLLKKKTEES